MKSHCCNARMESKGGKIEIERKVEKTYFVCTKCNKGCFAVKKSLDTNSDKSYNKGT